MSPAGIDRAIAFGLLAFLGGAICWLVDFALSPMMLIGLGAMTGSFDNWRTERGLWMLGALFLLIFGGFYLMLTYFQIADWWVGRAPLRGAMAFDWFLGTATLSYMVRFLRAVTYWNGRLSSVS